jgi:hypothetical protein
MSIRLPIRCVLELRSTNHDQVVLDYLTLAHIAPEPGIITTQALSGQWGCHQCNVSRRMQRLAASGLADVTASHHGYQVHGLWMPGEVM